MRNNIGRLAEKISWTSGGEVDLLVKNARIIDVFTGRIVRGCLAVKGGIIVGFDERKASTVLDADGLYASPGLIDGHIHVESSMLCPTEFARAVLKRGTTTVVADPHEIANVAGKEGIRYFLECSHATPLDIFVMLPSCVPATELETSGARLDAGDLAEFKDHPVVLGLAEVMNFPGVIKGDERILAKITLFSDKIIDGHAPGLSGRKLCAYVAAGIDSDHECTELEEAEEKLSRGMYVMIREGSTAKNMEKLLPLLTIGRSRYRDRLLFVTDDVSVKDLVENGHMDHILRRAVKLGTDPLDALRMVTLNAADRFRLTDRGALVPGRRADIVLFADLESFHTVHVIKDGTIIYRDGSYTEEASFDRPEAPSMPIKIGELSEGDFRITAKGKALRVIRLIPGQIVTEIDIDEIPEKYGHIDPHPATDRAKVAVIERHHGTGNIGLGFVRGLGIKGGAIASTIAHDSHNLIIAGTNDRDMLTAARAIKESDGGLIVVKDGRILASFPLPLAGLMSLENLKSAYSQSREVESAAFKLRIKYPDPFMALSFLSLPVIPKIKITDLGLVDSQRLRLLPLFI